MEKLVQRSGIREAVAAIGGVNILIQNNIKILGSEKFNNYALYCNYTAGFEKFGKEIYKAKYEKYNSARERAEVACAAVNSLHEYIYSLITAFEAFDDVDYKSSIASNVRKGKDAEKHKIIDEDLELFNYYYY